MDKLTVGEMQDVPEKLPAYLTKVCILKAHEFLRHRHSEVNHISFDDSAFTAEELTSFEIEAQSWEEFLEECRRAEHRKLDMMERELDKLSPKERTLLMSYYATDGSRTSMHELAQRMGYSSDRVAITLKSRIMRKLRTGIQQQEGALGNGLSPVAFFMPLFHLQLRKFVTTTRNRIHDCGTLVTATRNRIYDCGTTPHDSKELPQIEIRLCKIATSFCRSANGY